MVSRRLIAVWTFFDICLLSAGAITVAMSILLRAPNLLNNMVFTKAHITAGVALGISLLLTFVLSVGAIVQPNHVTIGLVILNWALLFDGIIVIVVGSLIWFFTLEKRKNYEKIFLALAAPQRVAVQDKFQCCGYFGVSDAEIGGNFCSNATFVQTTIAADKNFCVGPVSDYADRSLNMAFTSIYSFMAIIICLLLASLCVIRKREEDERFKKIDAKRGGRGFV